MSKQDWWYPGGVKSRLCFMEAKTIQVEYNGMLVTYSEDMDYSTFCDNNMMLETRVECGETTSDAMDCYYYCKERTRQ